MIYTTLNMLRTDHSANKNRINAQKWTAYVARKGLNTEKQGAIVYYNYSTLYYIGDTSPLELTHGKIYKVISVERGWYRIVDDTGEDYLYPAGNFEAVPRIAIAGEHDSI